MILLLQVWYPGSGVVLDCIDSDLCTLTYFVFILFYFLMEMFLAPLSMVYTFRNLFVLQKYVLMLMTSTIETHF